MRKICFHIDQPEAWALLLGNVYNTFNYFAQNNEEHHLLVVINGPAAAQSAKKGATLAGVYDELTTYIEKGLEVLVCQNALNAQQIAVDDLVEGVRPIPAAIIELVDRQAAGYAYIKP